MHPQETGIDCVDEFLARTMPMAIRRLRLWKGLDPSRHPDVVDDLRQEIAADFVSNRDALAALPKLARHERWLRIIGRSHYQLRRGVAEPADLDALPDPRHGATDQLLAARDAAAVEQLLGSAVRLKNGRLNEKITARSIGMTPLRLRDQQERIVDALDYGRHIEFWRRRLVEALIGLAADQLRDAARVLIHGEGARPRPDPSARRARIARIRRRLDRLPVGDDLRRVLTRCGPRRSRPLQPGDALDCAQQLAPRDPSVQLWLFEHCAARGDLARAMRALRQARALGGDAVAIVLARARILELRGCAPRAARLLARARRRRDDPRLRLCFERVQQCG